jgi:regulator of replication initiation timing
MLGEQKKINNQLLADKNALLTKVSELNVEVTCLNSQIGELKTKVENKYTFLNNVVEGEGKRQIKGIDFNY